MELPLGRDFLTPGEGQSYLQVQGRYFDDAGEEHAFERTVTPETAGMDPLSWRLWPDVVFHPQGNRLGYFLGTIRVIDEGMGGRP